MRTINPTDLVEIIRKHKIWLAGEQGGGKANLRYANLRYADLRYADLRSANLRYAKLTDTVLANINWLGYKKN